MPNETENIGINEEQKNESTTQGVKFTPEQQEFFNRTINERYSEWKNKSKAHVTALETKVKELENAVNQKSTANTEAPVDGKNPKIPVEEQLKQLTDKLAESQRIIEQSKAEKESWVLQLKNVASEKEKYASDLLNEKKDNLITNACAKEDFISPLQVKKLVGDYITYDKEAKTWKIYSESGEERFDEQLKPMSIEGFIKEFALKNPHLVKGAKIGGAGTQEGSRVSGRKWKRSEIAALPPSEYERLSAEIFKAMKEGRVIDG